MIVNLVLPALELLAALILMGLVWVYRDRLGPRVIWLMKEIILLSVVARRIDDLGLLSGLDLLSPLAGHLLTGLLLLAVGLSLIRFARVDRLWRDRALRIERLEALRRADERGLSWDFIRPYPRV